MLSCSEQIGSGVLEGLHKLGLESRLCIDGIHLVNIACIQIDDLNWFVCNFYLISQLNWNVNMVKFYNCCKLPQSLEDDLVFFLM